MGIENQNTHPIPEEPFLAWPRLRDLRWTVAVSALCGIIFYAIFGGADFITSHYSRRFPSHFDFERAIPFVPEMTGIYLSLNLLTPLAPFVFRRWPQLIPLFATVVVETAVAGMVFLVFPTRLAFEPVTVSGFWGPLYHLADSINLDHNEFPSLHVALAVTVAAAFGRKLNPFGKLLMFIWAGLIAASTVLIHAHHILDVVGGLALAMVGIRFIYAPLEADQDRWELRVRRMLTRRTKEGTRQ